MIAIGLLRTAAAVLSEDGCNDALFAVNSILEDFASLADAGDADSAAAHAHLIKMAAEDDCWDLGSANMITATRQAAADIRKMQKGAFDRDIFGTTFASKIMFPGWLLRAIENTEGNEASMEYANSVHAARHAAEAAESAAPLAPIDPATAPPPTARDDLARPIAREEAYFWPLRSLPELRRA